MVSLTKVLLLAAPRRITKYHVFGVGVALLVLLFVLVGDLDKINPQVKVGQDSPYIDGAPVEQQIVNKRHPLAEIDLRPEVSLVLGTNLEPEVIQPEIDFKPPKVRPTAVYYKGFTRIYKVPNGIIAKNYPGMQEVADPEVLDEIMPDNVALDRIKVLQEQEAELLRQQTNGTRRTTLRPLPIKRKQRLYTQPIGGIGNQLFQLASCIGIALSTDRIPVVSPAYEQLLRMFNITLDVALPHWSLPHVEEKGFATYSNIAYWKPPGGADAIMSGFFQSWKYFRLYRKLIKSQFQLRPSLLIVAADVKMEVCLVGICREQNPGSSVNSKPLVLIPNRDKTLGISGVTTQKATPLCTACLSAVYVGVHVRRKNIAPNYARVPAAYFRRAMDHFRRKYPNVVFLIVGDDIEWSQTTFSHDNDTYVVTNMAAEQHFAVLASCQHHVLSVGTFGWWAAWLAEGETVYYDQPVPKSFPDYFGFNPADFFPDTWRRLH